MIRSNKRTNDDYSSNPTFLDLVAAATSSVHQRFGLDFGIQTPEINGFNPDNKEVFIYSSALAISEKSIIGNTSGKNKQFVLAFVSDEELGTWVFCSETTEAEIQGMTDAYQERFKNGLKLPPKR